FSSRRRHTRFSRDWSSDVCSSDLPARRSGRVPPGPSHRRSGGHCARACRGPGRAVWRRFCRRPQEESRQVRPCRSLSIRLGQESDRRPSASVLTSLRGESILNRTAGSSRVAPTRGATIELETNVMSVVIPFLAVLLAGAFAAYHRLRLATWVAISAVVLAACWFLGAHPTATLVAAGIVAAVGALLLLPFLRKPL